MSEAAQSIPTGFAGSSFDDGPTAGMLLRQAREAAGLHVAALAVSLKVSVRKLEALEQDRLDLLPDPVFVRALAATICRTLKCDPQAVLDRLPQVVTDRPRQGRAPINAPFRTPGDGAAPAWFRPLLRPGFLAVFVLLAGVVALVLLPQTRLDKAVATDTVRPDVPAAPARAAAVPAPPATDPAVPMPAAAPAQDEGVVVFRATGPSWVEVSDGRGGVPLRKLLAAGETAQTSGPLPLKVTVGSADVTEVQVRGQRFDLAPVARDNVARFEVK